MGDGLLYFAAVLAGFWRFSAAETAADLGGAEGIRTPGLLHAMEARYQLRHSPVRVRVRRQDTLARFG
jgi:hypothetical protein